MGKMSESKSKYFINSEKLTRALSGKTDQKKLLSEEEIMKFLATFHTMVQDIVASEVVSDMPETKPWIAMVMNYNVPNGKLNRYVSTVK